MKKTARLIGLTGTNASGKGEVARFFKKKGYAYFSLSDLLREELMKKGKEASRDNLIHIGNRLREKFRADVLAVRVMKRIKGKAVIDSIRNPEEIRYLRRQKDFILLAVDAAVELRYARAKKRGRVESASTLQEFMAKEAEEMSYLPTGQQLQKCMQMADITIINDSTLENLYLKLEKLQ